MLAIRFQRRGRKNDPSFRIIVSEKARSPKAGNPLEILGSYDPITKATVIDGERVKHWISKGAELSGTVNNLLITKGIIEGKKVNVLRKRNIQKEEAKTEAQPAAAPSAAPAAVADAQTSEDAEATNETPAPANETEGAPPEEKPAA